MPWPSQVICITAIIRTFRTCGFLVAERYHSEPKDEHYGFTAEEPDHIINYDIKYRMGQDAEADGEGSKRGR